MGIIRKTMSVSSAGLVDFRSDKERIARSTRKTYKAVKAQTRDVNRNAAAELRHNQLQAQWFAAQAQQGFETAQAAAAATVAKPMGPGWYVDDYDDRFLRWYDGWGPSDVVQSIPDGPARILEPPPEEIVTGSLRPPHAIAAAPPAQLPAARSAGADLAADLARLGELHQQGILTDDEFAAAKAQALGLGQR